MSQEDGQWQQNIYTKPAFYPLHCPLYSQPSDGGISKGEAWERHHSIPWHPVTRNQSTPSCQSPRLSVRSRLGSMMNSCWAVELVTWVFSVMFLTGMIVILAATDRTWFSDWLFPWKISSIIALLNTGLKASMMVGVVASLGQLKWLWFTNCRNLKDIQTFDVASRGPSGAFKFVLTKGPFHLATLGATIIILTLGLDTMVQQVVSVDVASHVVPGAAWIPRSTLYDAAAPGLTGPVPGDQSPSITMVAAIFEGWFAPSSMSTLPDYQTQYGCESGTCTWESVQTLAVCQKCADITTSIEDDTEYYYIPNGPSITTSNGLLNMIGNTSLPESTTLTEVQPLIAYFSAISANTSGLGSSPTAAECALYWCVNEYDQALLNGNMNQTVLNTWYNLVPASYGQRENIVITPDSCIINGTDQPLGSADCTYTVTGWAHQGLQNGLPNFMVGNVYWQDQGYYFDGEAAQSVLWILENDQTDMFTAADLTFTYLAAYMTRDVREFSPAGEIFQTNIGDLNFEDLKFNVRWIWMLLPVSLVGSTFIFLIATIIRSKGYEKWKSSALAMMYNGIEEGHRIDLGPDADITQLHKAAETMQFQLMPRAHKKDYRLVGQSGHGMPYLR